ncbi:hemolysin III family protein [Streptomyces kaempferi]
MERAAAALKPRMRGWLHAGVFPLALAGGIVLIAVSRSAAAVAACSVYAVSACLLFGTSAVYHRGTWGPRGEAVLRRLDHANIFLIIAARTPRWRYCCCPQANSRRYWPWCGREPWPHRLPHPVDRGSPLAVHPVLHRARLGGRLLPARLRAHRRYRGRPTRHRGGLLYTAGAVVYGLKRPDPSPAWFGFHEIFHALTITAFTTHYTAILLAAT